MTTSNVNNIGAIDASGTSNAQSFFNNLSLPPITVSQNIDDAVIAYFQRITSSKESAKALAAAVILTSVSQGIDPMATLQEFMKMEKGQLNSYLAMFLNLNRVGTSYLGISNQPTASKYVIRTLLP